MDSKPTKLMPRSYRSIPKPREIPWLGSIQRRFHSPLDFFAELHREFGPAARFRLFNERFLLLCDPALINEVLVTKQDSFRKGRALEGARDFLGDSLLVSEGTEHLRQRRLIQPAFHRGRIAGYARVMAERAAQWRDARRAGEEIDIAVEMNHLTLDVVGETLFGSSVRGEAHEIAEALSTIIENFGLMMLPLWRLLKMIPIRQNRILAQSQKRLDEIILDLIARRRAEGGDRGDLLSMLLAAEDADNPEKRLSDREIRDQALTLFLAGHETTANALAWTWHLLSIHEPERLKMKAEIDEVMAGGRLPGLEDMPRLRYTHAILSESMRLFPPVWVVGRRAVEDVVIGDLEVPRRTIVVMSQYVIHRDEQYWPGALEFRPERWLDKAAEEARPKFAYFPFGGGARICIGESFAWAEGVLMLAVMAQRWRMEPVAGHPIAMNPTVTLRPKHGLRMIVREA
jgi:cytochrome P450